MSGAVGRRPGPIALVGSGEYLPQMDATDRLLLQHVGTRSARVVVLPTAAGLEPPASPARWARMGVQHFQRLGARAQAVNILTREDAFDPRWLPLLETADVIYFSGGNPLHVVQGLQDSPAWRTIRARHAAGAALAGCSAGAMAFGGFTLQPRGLWRPGARAGDAQTPAPSWYPALGLVPHVSVLPHFDRMTARMGQDTLARVAASLPPGVALIGVDEDTALVCLDGSAVADGPSVWQVMGRQRVAVFAADRPRVDYAAGATVVLEASTA